MGGLLLSDHPVSETVQPFRQAAEPKGLWTYLDLLRMRTFKRFYFPHFPHGLPSLYGVQLTYRRLYINLVTNLILVKEAN